MPDDLSSALDQIRERAETASKIEVSWKQQILRARASANDVPSLLAALDEVLKLADEWQRFAVEGDAQDECAREVRKVITSELTRKERQP